MKAAVALGTAALFFTLLIVAAFSWDSMRSLENAYDKAMAAEREVRNQEERFLAILPAIGAKNPDIEAAISKYRQTEDIASRRRAFQDIVSQIGTAKPTDPTDPIARRVADEFAGAQNRRQIALRHYQNAAAAYNEFAQGLRGRFGRALTDLPEELPE